MERRTIVLISGSVSSGKSSLAGALGQRYGFRCLKTRELILELRPRTRNERSALQRAGERLDKEHGGKWVARAVDRLVQDKRQNIVVDSVRTKDQIDDVRRAFGSAVVHVHLMASDAVLAERYGDRPPVITELATYKAVKKNATEGLVNALAQVADVVVDTEKSGPDEVTVRVAARLGLYGRGLERLVDVLVGGQYGSEGKGNIAAHLAPEYEVLVRVGGPNAGHQVYGENITTYHHLPSGTGRNEGAKILIGPGAVINVAGLLREVNDAELSTQRLVIDEQAMVIEEQDVQSERGQLVGSIGSTGQGVGAATARKILRTAASPPVRLAKDVPDLRPYVRPVAMELEDAFAAGKRVFLEGTQGTGLSLHHGNYPHVTSRDTTVAGCLSEAGIAPSRVRRAVMVCRSHPIRVQNPKDGTSGFMRKEIDWDTVAQRAELDPKVLKKAERTSTTRRQRRVAEFDWVLFRRSVSLNGPTDIALTFADYLSPGNSRARRFEQLDESTIRFIEELENVAGVPVSLIVTRFHYRCIIDRRSW